MDATLVRLPNNRNIMEAPLSSDLQRFNSAIREVTNTTGMPSFVGGIRNPVNVPESEFLDPQDRTFKEMQNIQFDGDLPSLEFKLVRLEAEIKKGLNRFRPMKYEKKQIATLKQMIDHEATKILDKIRRRSLGTAEKALKELVNKYELWKFRNSYGYTTPTVTKEQVEAGEKILNSRQDYKEKLQKIKYLEEQSKVKIEEQKLLKVANLDEQEQINFQESTQLTLQEITTDPQVIYDFKLTTPTDSNLFNQKITADPATDFHNFVRQTGNVIADLEQKGLYTAETVALFTKGFAKGTAEYLYHAVNHPIEYVQGFVHGNLELAKQIGTLFLDIASLPSDESTINEHEMQRCEQVLNRRIESITQVYNTLCETIPQMSREDWGHVSSRLFTDYLIFKGAGKGLNIAKNAKVSAIIKQNSLLAKVHNNLEQALLKHPELITPEGITLKGVQVLEETGIVEENLLQAMSNDAQKVKKNIPLKELTNDITENIEVTEKPLDYGRTNIHRKQLKEALRKEEIKSIIDVTEHGLERLIERDFEMEEILALVTKPDYMKIQNNGTKALIKEISNNKYNIMIVNPETKKVVSALRNIDKQAIENLGKNYGWSIEWK